MARMEGGDSLRGSHRRAQVGGRMLRIRGSFRGPRQVYVDAGHPPSARHSHECLCTSSRWPSLARAVPSRLHSVQGFPRQREPGGFPPQPFARQRFTPTLTRVAQHALSRRGCAPLPATDPSSLGRGSTCRPGGLHPRSPPSSSALGLPTPGDRKLAATEGTHPRTVRLFVWCARCWPPSPLPRL